MSKLRLKMSLTPPENRGAQRTKSVLLIFPAQKNENNVNIQMGGMYNKIRIASRAAADLPEVRPLHCVPIKATHKISQTTNLMLSYKKAG